MDAKSLLLNGTPVTLMMHADDLLAGLFLIPQARNLA